MKPNLPMFAKLDDDIQKILKEEGWSEQCTNIYTIVAAYEKATSYKDKKYHTISPGPDIITLIANNCKIFHNIVPFQAVSQRVVILL